MIVLLGAGGYIGSAFADEMTRRGLDFVAVKHDELYKCSIFNPDLIINCAAFIPGTSVQLCEQYKEECVRGNLVFPIAVKDQCELTGVPLMHISTGCLYQGNNSGNCWSEKDRPQLTFNNGAGFYIGCKELAERMVSHYPLSYCLRIRLPFDGIDHPRNLLSKLLYFDKVIAATNSLTHRTDFVRAALDLWEKHAAYGIYNMTNPSSASYPDIMEMLVKKGLRNNDWVPVSIEDFQQTARTVQSNCSLDTSKLLAAGVRMRSVHDALVDSISNWRKPCTTT